MLGVFQRPLLPALLALTLLAGCHRKAVPTTTSAAGPGTSAPSTGPQYIEPSLPKLEVLNTRFAFLSAKGKAMVDLKNNKQNANLSLRMRRDSIIWMSASLLGIEGVRICLTRDSVRVLNRIEKTYFAGGYDYLSKLLNVPVTYADMQALLLGDYVPAPAGSKPTLATDAAGRQRVSYPRNGLSVERLVQAATHRVQQLRLSESGSPRSLTVDYTDFKPLEGQAELPFANSLLVQAQQTTGAITAAVDFSKVSVSNEVLEFPFEVPKGYSRTK